MALTFPRDLPSPHDIRSVEPFHLEPVVTRAPDRGGMPQVVELARASWTVTYRTAPLPRAALRTWEAWIDSLRGGVRTFKAHHPRQAYARTYPNGYGGLVIAGTSTPFAGIASVSAINTNLQRLQVIGLPASFKLLAGDLLSVAVGASPGRELYRVMEDATANVGAGFSTLDDLQPPIRPDIQVGAEVLVLRPWFEAVIDPDSVRKEESIDGASIQFSARQVRRA